MRPVSLLSGFRTSAAVASRPAPARNVGVRPFLTRVSANGQRCTADCYPKRGFELHLRDIDAVAFQERHDQPDLDILLGPELHVSHGSFATSSNFVRREVSRTSTWRLMEPQLRRDALNHRNCRHVV